MRLRNLVLTLALAPLSQLHAAPPPIASHFATIDGVKLHYLQAGHGPALVLFHGFAETSLMWRPAMAEFAQNFTVIAPDLPGIGDSAIPPPIPSSKP
jgi:pimeloyl-ACP methyl ester carboxylesterase